MKIKKFWKYYETVVPVLNRRESTFRKMFEYLDKCQGPITIIETGCARTLADGHSTVLFDRYVNDREDGSCVYSVDLNQQTVESCRTMVGPRTTVTISDSVVYLHQLAKQLLDSNTAINLLYLDSYDIDWEYWYPSAAHHLKELLAVHPAIDAETLVVVDDCPGSGLMIHNGKNYDIISNPIIGGKGRLIADYARAIGAKTEFASYQAGWTGL
jgi:hypothetical protein